MVATRARLSTYVAQAPTPGAPNVPNASGVLITQSGSGVDVAEGGATDSYQIVLQTTPSADVTITVDPDAQTDLGAGAGVAIVLTFTTANALIPQVVNVAAVDDMIIEGTHTSLITHTAASADSGYNGLAIANVTATISDNDFPPPTPYRDHRDHVQPGFRRVVAGNRRMDRNRQHRSDGRRPGGLDVRR